MPILSAPTAALTKSSTGFPDANTFATLPRLAASAAPPPASTSFCMKPRRVAIGLNWSTDLRICSRRPVSGSDWPAMRTSCVDVPENRAVVRRADGEPDALAFCTQAEQPWISLGDGQRPLHARLLMPGLVA